MRGSWCWSVIGPSMMHGPRATELVLTSSGHAEMRLESTPGDIFGAPLMIEQFRWWVEGSDFVSRYKPRTAWGAIGTFAVETYEDLTGRASLYRQRIVSIESNRICLECPNVMIDDKPDVQTLTRIPE